MGLLKPNNLPRPLLLNLNLKKKLKRKKSQQFLLNPRRRQLLRLKKRTLRKSQLHQRLLLLRAKLTKMTTGLMMRKPPLTNLMKIHQTYYYARQTMF
jgi:hypothetical protein